jgi:hypothetical protein
MKLPEFTGKLEEAVQLASLFVQDGVDWGVSWEEKQGSAIIGEGSEIQASTPSLALCCAVILHVAKDRARVPVKPQ